MKKILVFGGTQFVGKTIVEKLVSLNQYDITLFNRGKTDNETFSELRLIKGDRETGDIEQIGEESWDYVIDVSCYYPRMLESALAHLESVDRYIFISTCSVYDNQSHQGTFRNEDTPILPCTEEQRTDRSLTTYGQRKAACERILRASGLDHIIFRPALVYGPQDYTDRLYYWLYQVKTHPTLLLPNMGESKFSLTYVKDLADVVARALSMRSHNTTYTLTSHPGSSIKAVVESAARILDRQPEYINATPGFLHGESIAQWSAMPLWLDNNHFTYDNAKLKKDFGFAPRDFDDSIRETIAFFDQKGWPTPVFGMSEEKRMDLLAKIKAA